MKHAVHSLITGRPFIIAIGIGLMLLVAAPVAWWGYGRHCEAKNRQAQLAFSENLKRFELLKQDPKAQPAAWKAVAADFSRDYERFADSSLAPYFLAFQSEATEREGNRKEAIALLDRALSTMGNVAPLYYLYAIKRGTLILETADTAEQGRKELLSLAQDKKNPYQGLAWYALWQYAWVHRDEELVTLAHAKLQAFAQLSAAARSQSEAIDSDTYDAQER